MLPLDGSLRILRATSTDYMLQVRMSAVEYERACRERPGVQHEIYDNDARMGGDIVVSILPMYDAPTTTHAWLLAAMGERRDADVSMDLLRACCHMELVYSFSVPDVVEDHRHEYEALCALVPGGVIADPGWMRLRDLWNWAFGKSENGCRCDSCGEPFKSVVDVDGLDSLLRRSDCCFPNSQSETCVRCAPRKRRRVI